MTYEVEVRPSARRAIHKLDRPVQKRILDALTTLQDNPRPPGCKKLEGANDLYRIQVGPRKAYRIIYQICEAALVVLVVKVGHRKNVYRRVR